MVKDSSSSRRFLCHAWIETNGRNVGRGFDVGKASGIWIKEIEIVCHYSKGFDKMFKYLLTASSEASRS